VFGAVPALTNTPTIGRFALHEKLVPVKSLTRTSTPPPLTV